MQNPEARIVVYWTLLNDQGHGLSCELCRTASGLEVRCIDATGAVVRTGPVAHVRDGSEVSSQWKNALLAKGDHFERLYPRRSSP